MRTFSDEETASWFASLEKRMSSSEVALCTPDDRVIVVKANYKDHWSLPGGIIDAGETPAVAAVREVAEEIGLIISPEALSFKLIVDWVSTVAQSYQFIFEALIDTAQLATILLDTTEIDEYALVSRQQIIEGDRAYAESTRSWAKGITGYQELVLASGSR
jgi:8-oxo-dGTP pyrophosphatase MutT (NUDIX family)